jgi:GNAT superfamily N-acetyltransferase
LEIVAANERHDLGRFGEGHGAPIDAPRRRRTLVAVLDGEAVGVATSLWSTRHPDVVTASALVDPSVRRQGIGTLLLRELAREAAQLLLVSLPVGDPAESFVRHLGYVPVVESTTVRIEVDDAVERWSDDPVLDVTIERSAMNGDVEQFYESVYRRCHRWAGRYVPTPGVSWIAMAGDVIEATLFVARRRGTLVAAAGVLTGPFAESADGFVVPTGTLGIRDSIAAQRVLETVLRRSLVAARQTGVRRVNVEFDTPYVELAAAVDRLRSAPVVHSRTWCSVLLPG